MTMPTLSIVDANGLRERLESGAGPRIIDVRTPAEFETVHIAGAYNVPLDLLREHRHEIIGHLDEDVILVCRSGQRASQAEEALRAAGLDNVHVLDGGMGMMLSKLPYNRGASCDLQTVVTQLTP